MRTDEVPQDRVSTFDGHSKAVYARDADGRYTTVETSGWQVEETATRLAVQVFEESQVEARARCLAGESAPLEYHMCDRRMDLPTLAEAAGIARWRVRRHLRPRVFRRLPQRILRRYAEALQMPVTALQQLPEAADGNTA